MPKLLRPFLNQISNLVLIRFKENKILMLTVGSRKILKIVIEIQFKFAMTIFFSGFFVFFFSFGLIGFGLYYFDIMAILRPSMSEKNYVCVCVCFEREGPLVFFGFVTVW